MAPDRPEEQFAFNVVGRVLGVDVEHYDRDGRQGAVDAILHYPDGRRAALEVSSIGSQDEARIRGKLDEVGPRRDIPGLTQVWSVHLPNSFLPRDLPLIDAALLRCEELGFDSLIRGIFDDELRTLLSQGVNAELMPTTGPSDPRAYVFVRDLGTWSGSGTIYTLSDDLGRELATPGMQENIEKLAASGLEDRHLFLMVRSSAFGGRTYTTLSFDGLLPTSPPRLPAGLTDVWLASELIAGGVIRATADGQWHREPVEQSDRVHVRRQRRTPRSP